MIRRVERPIDAKLVDLINPNLVVEFDASGQRETLLKLVEPLVGAGVLTAGAAVEVAEGMLRREAFGTSGLGRGLAIPHVRSPHVDRPHIIVGRSQAPVEWAAVDGLPVRLFFAVVAPPPRPGKPQRPSGKLTRFLAAAPIDRLLDAADFRQAALDLAIEFDHAG